MNDLKEVYTHNRFKIGDIDFSLADKEIKNFPQKPFAIITAWNPNNEQIDRMLNIEKNMSLQRELEDKNFIYEKALGYLGEHSEESYCIYDISFDDAVALGKAYGQYAIFYSDGKEAGYYEVKTKHTIVKYNDVFRN